jgi:putative oxidoreductase
MRTTATRSQDGGLAQHRMPPTLERLTPLAGRGLVSTIFVLSALGKLASFSGTADMMAAKGFPIAPFFLLGAIVLELGGGLSVLTGYKARWGALALIVFLIPTTLIYHNFWAYSGQQLAAEMIQFLKNVAIVGGLLATYSFGPGAFSLGSRSTTG